MALHNRHKKELADISAALAVAYEETRIEAAASYRLMVGLTGAGMAGGLMHGPGQRDTLEQSSSSLGTGREGGHADTRLLAPTPSASTATGW